MPSISIGRMIGNKNKKKKKELPNKENLLFFWDSRVGSVIINKIETIEETIEET